MKYIKIDTEVRKALRDELNTTSTTIKQALYYFTNTKRAKEIRKRALELGAVEVEEIEVNQKQ